MSQPSFEHVAVLIPCYNEEATIAAVIKDFYRALPGAAVYVFDNNSSDDTINVALSAGAIVRQVRFQGKGSVVRRMFADIEAEAYVLVDGDDTYDAAQAPELVGKLLVGGLDMVVGMRETQEQAAYRTGHKFGNVLLSKCVAVIFGEAFKDMLSGYRVFSRRYVKSFPAHSMGFEIETELTVHASNCACRCWRCQAPTNPGRRDRRASLIPIATASASCA
jgi:glycosyltransferase involved in cell wall biosynthesis